MGLREWWREGGWGVVGWVRDRRGGGVRYGFAVLAKSSAVRHRTICFCLDPSPDLACPETRSKGRREGISQRGGS